MLDYNKSILSNNFNPSKFDFNPWDLDVHLEKGERDPEKTENMIEKNPGGPTISFRLYTNQSFQQRGQIGMCSPDSNRGRAQLTARRQQAAGFHWCRRPVPKMAFHALSLAILGKAMSSMALPLTSPALLPSVAGWDCSNPLNLTVSDASKRCTAATAATSETNGTECVPRAKNNFLWTNPWNPQK